jgi:hypothetical protein
VKTLVRGILLFLVVACTALPRASDPMGAPLEITLRMGQMVDCGLGMAIQFQDVLQDSRCPEGASCIWAGNARVALTVKRTSRRPVSIELNTNADPKSAEIGNYSIELVHLRPTRRVNEKLDKRTYTVTLRVKGENSRP